MMLAAVASVALAAPAFAWDFSASGTSSAYFNSTSTVTATGADTASSGGVTSAASSLKLASGHTDGSKTLSLSYTLDWDGNLDETITLSGSSTVGAWTASGDVSYSRDDNGCYASTVIDNGTASASTACAGAQTGEDTTAVTLTDGTMTIKLGEAGHLSSQNVSSGSAAAGAISHDGASDDASIGAMVDSFHGASLGYKISDTMSATVAYQNSGDADDMMGTGEYMDGETNATHGTSGFGVGFSGTFGPATVGFTSASASTSNSSGLAAYDTLSSSSSTMGLGVAIDLGDIDPFISYGSTEQKGGSTSTLNKHSGSEFGLTYALGGSDSVVIYIGSSEDTYSSTDEPLKKSGMELGYNTMVGPASLKVGYGTTTKADADDATVDGYSMSDIEVALSYSF